jgi:hypothetical protein
MTGVLALCTNCDLRVGPTQCELSDQEVTVQPVPYLTSTACGRGAARAVRHLTAGKDSGGRQ